MSLGASAKLHSVAFNGGYGDYHGPILQIHCIAVLSNPHLWLSPGSRYRIFAPRLLALAASRGYIADPRGFDGTPLALS
jgi:hypothetical protein